MSNSHSIGALFLIAERSLGREFFLGRATGESDSSRLALEGKILLVDEAGSLTVQPFATRSEFCPSDPNYRIQRIDQPDAVDEVTRILTLSVSTITRESSPLLARWFGSQVAGCIDSSAGASETPFGHVAIEFWRSAERFRRALICSPQVTATHELDRLVELEGDLTIEIGKLTGKLVGSFNRMLEGENELAHFMYRLGDPTRARKAPFDGLGGWTLCASRLNAAKNWAVARAQSVLVRELSTLLQEGNTRVGQILLEHQSALDALACEALGRHGIQPESVEPPAFVQHGESQRQHEFAT